MKTPDEAEDGEADPPGTGSMRQGRAMTVWRRVGGMLRALVFAALCFIALVVLWGLAWEFFRNAFELDEVQWWNREIEYAEIWRWLTGR